MEQTGCFGSVRSFEFWLPDPSQSGRKTPPRSDQLSDCHLLSMPDLLTAARRPTFVNDPVNPIVIRHTVLLKDERMIMLDYRIGHAPPTHSPSLESPVKDARSA